MSGVARNLEEVTGNVFTAGGWEARRAVVWAAPEVTDRLGTLLRKRRLEPERVASAPAAVHAVLRPGAALAAVILVEPARLPGAAEAVEVLRKHAPGVRCWRFEPPPAGPGAAGLLQPLDGGLALHPRGSGAAAAGTAGAATRLSREELAMLLGPTRTLTPAAPVIGDAG